MCGLTVTSLGNAATAWVTASTSSVKLEAETVKAALATFRDGRRTLLDSDVPP